MRSTATKVLAVGRLANGVAFLVAPASAGPSWIGRSATADGTRIVTRGFGARDIGLGAGALAASDEASQRSWMKAMLLADATDFLSTLVLERDIPRTGRLIGLAVTASATAMAAVGSFAGD